MSVEWPEKKKESSFNSYHDGYNQAIDDFMKVIESHPQLIPLDEIEKRLQGVEKYIAHERIDKVIIPPQRDEVDYVGKCPECKNFGHIKLRCNNCVKGILDEESLKEFWFDYTNGYPLKDWMAEFIKALCIKFRLPPKRDEVTVAELKRIYFYCTNNYDNHHPETKFVDFISYLTEAIHSRIYGGKK